jgi:hypothetical protein
MRPEIDRPGPGRRGTSDGRVLRQQAGGWLGSIPVSVVLTARLLLPLRSCRRRGLPDEPGPPGCLPTRTSPVSLPLFLQGLGSVGVFASRAFLPAFVTALLLRLGPQMPWLAHAGLLPHVRGVPTWFTSDAALVVLGLLAILELVAERFPESKAFLDAVHEYLKTGMAVLT